MSTRLATWLLPLLMLAAVVPARTAAAADTKAAAGKAAPAAAAKDPAQAARARALQDGWPDTPAGLLAYTWVEAFSSGERAMQSFLETHIRKESLAKRPMKERLATYRAMRDKLGSLTLASVEKSDPAELTADLLAEDATQHRFVFKVEPRAPHYLISIGTFDRRHGGHGGGGGH